MINSIPNTVIGDDIDARIYDSQTRRYIWLGFGDCKVEALWLNESEARRLLVFLTDALVDKRHEKEHGR